MKPRFHIIGKVRAGKKRGKTLGFPSANISLHQKIPQGIYLSTVKIRGKQYNALTFIGNATTFGETLYQAETYILDFNTQVYESWISIKLLKKLRANKKFPSSKELIAQMRLDEKKARAYFQKKHP